MHIVAAGLNYRTAPVEIREKVSFSDAELTEALGKLKEARSVLECVIVSTCNRTEIYAVVDRPNVCRHMVREFLESGFRLPFDQIEPHLYRHEGRDAIRHLFRVTCGLDSMVVGETQILGQVRDAFLKAQAVKATGTLFNTLFKQAVTLAKRAHAETAINDNPVSVSYAAVELGKRIFGHFRGKSVMIVGAGKMGELTLKHLTANGADRIIVVNRTFEKAVELAEKVNGTACPLERMADELWQADIVISSTGSSGYLLTRDDAERAMKRRKSRPLFLIDIAVPRDLDPAIGQVSNVYLYNIDDLQQIVETNRSERLKEAAKIEKMVEAETTAFEQWLKTLGVGPVIQALQQKANDIHEHTMESLLNKLPDLNDREIEVIRKLTKSMLNQMMRDPILRVKELAAERRGEDMIELFAHLFALEQRLAELEAGARAGKADPAAATVLQPDRSQERASALALAGGEIVAGT